MAYRSINDMDAEDLLAELEAGAHFCEENAVHQIELFVRMGGDPNDHNYARLSYLTKELRAQDIPIKSSRHRGLWLEP